MQNSVARGFRNVLRFRGRDTRPEFWAYAGTVVGGYFVIFALGSFALVAAIPMTVAQFFLAHAFVSAGAVALLAAAVSRRLHDSGLSAFWGLLPVPFLIYSSATIVRFQSELTFGVRDNQLFGSILASNALYMVGLVWLIVLLVRCSTPGPNRFG